jgi:hypothetical protein
MAVRDKQCETSGLFSVQGANLGQEGQDQRCHDRPQGGNGAETLALACGGLILGNLPGNLGIKLCDGVKTVGTQIVLSMPRPTSQRVLLHLSHQLAFGMDRKQEMRQTGPDEQLCAIKGRPKSTCNA